MFDILNGLNEEQTQAVTSIDGYIRVIAGAGSGKTKALTHRYAYLVEECGISPSSILSVTFTNKAAQEMKNRIRSMIGDQDLGYICTFHGLCVRILREDIHFLHYPKNFAILDVDDQNTFLSDVYNILDIDDFFKPYSEARTEIAKLKSYHLDYYVKSVTDPNGFKPNASNIFSEYLKLQRKNYALDFSDLINFTLYLLKTFPSVREKWQKRFEYIQVDEFQDVSQKEFELVSILSKEHKNLFIVGDPDQTIYSWRGADVKYILSFRDEFPDTKDIAMVKNYRSSNDVLQASNHLIKHNKKRLEKELLAATSEQMLSNQKVVHYHAKTQAEEAKWITDTIKELTQQGYEYKDMAILYRSRYAVPALEIALRNADVKYKICDGIAFYSRKEIKTIIAYFSFILNQDDLNFRKIINAPARSIGKTRMDFLKSFSEENGVTLFEALKINLDNKIFKDTLAESFVSSMEHLIDMQNESTVSDLLTEILAITGLEKQLMTNNDDEDYNSIAELKNQIFDEEKSRGEKMTLQNYLDEVSLISSSDFSNNTSEVSLMTIHSAKGLEFKVVFVCELNEGTFPTVRTYDLDAMEEERRIAYVALTRARDRLYLTDAESISEEGNQARYTSRFIENISPGLLDKIGKYSEQYDKEKASAQIFASENEIDKKGHNQFKVGDKIFHEEFGTGIITGIDIAEDSYVVDFSGKEVLIKREDRTALSYTTTEEPARDNKTTIQNDVELSIGDKVEHKVFGVGTITGVNYNRKEISVKFEKYETERKLADASKLTLLSKATSDDVLGVNDFLQKHSVGDKISHAVYGSGTIESIENGEYIVKLDSGATIAIPINNDQG